MLVQKESEKAAHLVTDRIDFQDIFLVRLNNASHQIYPHLNSQNLLPYMEKYNL